MSAKKKMPLTAIGAMFTFKSANIIEQPIKGTKHLTYKYTHHSGCILPLTFPSSADNALWRTSGKKYITDTP